jgi:hypothetical protein
MEFFVAGVGENTLNPRIASTGCPQSGKGQSQGLGSRFKLGLNAFQAAQVLVKPFGKNFHIHVHSGPAVILTLADD